MLWIKTLLQDCNNDSVTVHLFLHLLTTSDDSGAVTTTLRKLAGELKTTVKKTATRLTKLESTGLIAIEQKRNKKGTKREQKGTFVTICNYESYAVLDIGDGNSKGTAREQQGNNTKETNKENISPTPPIKENKKENISSTTTACAHEGFIEELKTDRTWGEVIAMRYSLGSLAELDDWINKFSLDVVCRDTRHKNLQDAKRHFCDWLRINLREQNNGQKHNSTSKAEHIASERERIMREVASAAPRECDAPSWLD